MPWAVAGSGRVPNSARSPPLQKFGPWPRRCTDAIVGSAGRQLQGGDQFVAHASAVGVAPLRAVEGDPEGVVEPLQRTTGSERPSAARAGRLSSHCRCSARSAASSRPATPPPAPRPGPGRLPAACTCARVVAACGLRCTAVSTAQVASPAPAARPDPRRRGIGRGADQDVRSRRAPGGLGRGGAGGDDHAWPPDRRLQLRARPGAGPGRRADHGTAHGGAELVAAQPGPHPVEQRRPPPPRLGGRATRTTRILAKRIG